MTRSVVRESTPRCDRCCFAPRWCICAGFQHVTSPIQVDVLIHDREFWRPTSTGRLINRVIPSSRSHLFRRDCPPSSDTIIQPGRPVWILHPRGDALPADGPPPDVQLLLIDGTWREAARIYQLVQSWGQAIRLPMSGPSRYWLRDAQGDGKYSTIEALLFLFKTLGLTEAEASLRLQFELNVYAGLRARGATVAAAKFLVDSPVQTAFPELLRQLDQRRPRSAV